MLKGNQVTLRAIERDDIKRLHELYQNVEQAILADGNWQPVPLAAREKRFDKHLDSDNKTWFVIEVDGRMIGDIELHSIDRRSRVAGLGVAIFETDNLGKGYGREAIGLLLGWAFEIENYERVWLNTWATNERAIRCYRALGFVDEGRQRNQIFVNGAYVDVILMGLLRDEWRAQKQGESHVAR